MTLALAASEPLTEQPWNGAAVRFTGKISESNVKACIDKLALIKPGEIIFNCPGGEPRAVMRLFDFIREAQNITTVSRGYAASAGTILLQAGRRRIIGSEGYLMIKNPALWMPDEEYLAEFANRVEKVLLARAAEAAINGTADSPISQVRLRENWNRADWWLDSAEALKLGIVDGCRLTGSRT